jgi:SAM-dependent methyltransferase
MNQPSEASTVRYYDDHAQEFVRGTVGVEMESLYQPFLVLVPEGGSILDAGCGSGRDTKAFMDRGYRVKPIDASTGMVEATALRTGQPAEQRRFQDLDSKDEFDGIWACASLLHVPLAELDDVLVRFTTALQMGGICYLSFKEGHGERTIGGRLFTDFTEYSLLGILKPNTSLDVLRTWITKDLRPGRHEERWVNALFRKV